MEMRKFQGKQDHYTNVACVGTLIISWTDRRTDRQTAELADKQCLKQPSNSWKRLKTLRIPVKQFCDGLTDRRIDGPMDRPKSVINSQVERDYKQKSNISREIQRRHKPDFIAIII